MNGTDISFDTNALIGFLGGNPGLKKYANSRVILSVITIMEFLSYPAISSSDKQLLNNFLLKVTVIDLRIENQQLIDKATLLRKQYRLKLPDAIIAATALLYDCQLVTNDKALDKIADLNIIAF